MVKHGYNLQAIKKRSYKFNETCADLEDSTGKNPVTPVEVLPARELLGDMFLQMNDNANALQTYEAVLTKCPNRFNSLYGAGKIGNKKKLFINASSYQQ